jgi:hypothetical protein
LPALIRSVSFDLQKQEITIQLTQNLVIVVVAVVYYAIAIQKRPDLVWRDDLMRFFIHVNETAGHELNLLSLFYPN